jgi:hypothetical protein
MTPWNPAFGVTNQIVFASSISNTDLLGGVKTEYAYTAFSSSSISESFLQACETDERKADFSAR